jgi:hypothetical protein
MSNHETELNRLDKAYQRSLGQISANQEEPCASCGRLRPGTPLHRSDCARGYLDRDCVQRWPPCSVWDRGRIKTDATDILDQIVDMALGRKHGVQANRAAGNLLGLMSLAMGHSGRARVLRRIGQPKRWWPKWRKDLHRELSV